MGWLGSQQILCCQASVGHRGVERCLASPHSMAKRPAIGKNRQKPASPWKSGRTRTPLKPWVRILQPTRLITQCRKSTEAPGSGGSDPPHDIAICETSEDINEDAVDQKHCVDNNENVEATDTQLQGRWSSGEGTVSVFSNTNQAYKPIALGFLTCAVIVAFFRIASLKPLVKNQTIVSRAKALVTFARQSWENVRIFVSAYFKVYVEEPFLYASEKLLSSRAKRIFALFVCTIFIVGVGALAWHNATGAGFWDAIYNSWSFIASPDNRSLDKTSERLISSLLTIGGFFTFSVMISFTTEFFVDIANRIASGQGRVVEKGHSVVLGWSPEVHMAVREIAIVSATVVTELGFNRKVVVVAKQPKDVIDETLKQVLGEYAVHVDLVTRVGEIMSVGDVYKYSLRRAKRVIVFDEFVKDRDAYRCVPTLLSLKKTIEQVALTNKLYPTTIFLTSTYCPLYNKVLRNISFPGFHYLDGGIFISTLLSETVTCRPGICSVFQTLFAFEGSEFHLERVSEISGKTFGEATRHFDEAQCMGLLRDSEFIFCPQSDRELQSGDTLVLLAESQSRCKPLVDPLPALQAGQLDLCSNFHVFDNFKLVVCGWRRGMERMLQDIDKVSAPGSSVTIVSKRVNKRLRDEAFQYQYRNISVHLEDGDPLDGDTLLQYGIESADCILFTRDQGVRATNQSVGAEELPHDTQLLAFMLVLEEMHQKKMLKESLRVTCEVEDDVYIDMLNRQIVTDILIPSKILGSVACQLAVSPQLSQVYDALLNPEKDVFIYISPIPSTFCEREIEFRHVVEIPIGILDGQFTAMAPNQTFEFSESHQLVVMGKDVKRAGNYPGSSLAIGGSIAS